MKSCENANDVAYWKVLVDAAEQFFKGRVKELEQLCINRLKASISGSMSQFTKKSLLDSKAVFPIQTYGKDRSSSWNMNINSSNWFKMLVYFVEL